MLQLLIHNSNTFVKDGNAHELGVLANLLRYRPDGYFFSKLYKRRVWDGWVKLYDKQKGSFQTGLLPDVIKEFKRLEIPFKKLDFRKKPKKTHNFEFVTEFHTLRPYQQKSVDLFLKKHRGVLNIFTGAGKTAIALKIIQELGVRTLFVAPNTTIMHQAAGVFSDVFGKNVVGVVYGKKKDAEKPICVACVDSLPMFPKAFFDQFDLLILDEFHHASAETYIELNKKKFNGIYYRLGLTATFFRNDHSEMKMHGVLADVLLKMDSKAGIRGGFLTEPYFFIKSFHHINVISNYKKAYKFQIVENNDRNMLIKRFSDFCMKKNMSTLILVREIKHGKLLNQLIPDSVFIHGTHEYREEIIERFKKQEIKLVISTNILGEGADIPCLQAIIMAQALKAEGDIIQKIGRALRKFPTKRKAYIFDIQDDDKKHFQKQSAHRIKAYKKNYTNKISHI